MLNIAGVDEAGRGPLAGPVVAGAVIFLPGFDATGLDDSKKLSLKKREYWYDKLIAETIWAIGIATAAEIDKLNILQASLVAMHRAVVALRVAPSHVLVDGNKLPKWEYSAEAIIGGDATVAVISAASIVAKVTRDRMMLDLDAQYPEYGFAVHKGYPTKDHMIALAKHGACFEHRRSFAPVQRVLESAI